MMKVHTIAAACLSLVFLFAFATVLVRADGQDDVIILEFQATQNAQVQLVPTDKGTLSAQADGKDIPVSVDQEIASINLQEKSNNNNGKSKSTRSSKPRPSKEPNDNGSDSAGFLLKASSTNAGFVGLLLTSLVLASLQLRRSSLLVSLAVVLCVLVACMTPSECEVNGAVDVKVFVPTNLNLISHEYFVTYSVSAGSVTRFYFFPKSRSLALVAATSSDRLNNVAAGLNGVGFSVTTFDATTTTPTATQLRGFKYALVFSDPLHAFANKDALGDALASAFDKGVRVVTATFSNTAESPLGGKFADVKKGYLLLNPSLSAETSSAFLGASLKKYSYLTAGVNTFSAETAYRTSNGLVNKGTAAVSWNDGEPLIVVGKVKRRRRTDLNFFPVANSTSDPTLWVGDGWTLLRNAIAYSS